MDLQLSFLAVGQNTQRAEVGRKWSRMVCIKTTTPGEERVRGENLRDFFSSQGTVGKQRGKGCVFKQLFSKMELVVSEPITASLWRLPLLLWAGAKTTLRSEDKTPTD